MWLENCVLFRRGILHWVTPRSPMCFAVWCVVMVQVCSGTPIEMIQDFCSNWPGVPPYNRVQQFGKDFVQTTKSDPVGVLEQTLQNHPNEPKAVWWKNVPFTLGMLATKSNGDGVYKALKAFVEDGKGTLSEDVYLSKSNAVLALGFVLQSTASRDCLQYLEEGTRPETWERLKWSSPNHKTDQQLHVYLARRSFAALGVSGNEMAAAYIREHCSGEYQDVCDDALRSSEQVRQGGLAAVYK
jgi:hypothetical protein